MLAAGDNAKGQLAIAGTRDAVMVAAGAYHSVALKRDGTVAAFGSDRQGQCKVTGWTDVVYIACSGYDTIGLRSDGSVLCAGMHGEEISAWHNVKQVCGGAYAAGCLNLNGTMTSTGVTAFLPYDDLISVSVCGPAAAGIRSDGSLVTTIEDFPEWENAVSVKAGNLGVFAIDTDGNVLGYFYRATDKCDLTLPEKAAEIEVCGTHLAILGESGRVYCFGDNSFGQGETASWKCAVR